jgi:acetyltransferase-like isoleucine patch superfamily enzyme
MTELLKSPLTFWLIWLLQHIRYRNYCRLDYMARIEASHIGRHTRLYREAVLKHSSLDDWSYIGRGSHVQCARIGKYCSIAPGVTIGGGTHPTDQRSTHPSQYEPGTIEGKQVIIGHDVWIGQCAIILDGISIGNGAVIGAGCVVTRNVRKFSIVGGNPMRTIRKRPVQDETWYNESLLDNTPLTDIEH